MTADIAQQASHDYLRMASDMLEAHEFAYSAILVRAAEAEVNDPRTVNPPWCGCMVCQAVLTAARLRRTVG